MSEENELPEAWVEATLQDISSSGGTRGPRSVGDDFLYVDIDALDNKIQKIVSPKRLSTSEAPSRARMAINTGDIIFSLVRPYLKNIAIVPQELDGQIASTAYCVMRPEYGIVSSFIYFAILRESFINSIVTYGNSPPSARDNEFLNMSISLAPTNEQHRIVAAIEQQFTRLDAAVTALKHAKAKLKRYRASVLKAAVEGKLTEAWRAEHPATEPANVLLERILIERRAKWEADLRAKGKDPAKVKYVEPAMPDVENLPDLPEGWCWATAPQLASTDKYSLAIGPFGSNLKVEDYCTEGVPLIFVRNIRSAIFDGANTHYVTRDKADGLRAHQVAGGDILITKMGDPPGDACLYPINRPTAIITADCIKWTLSPMLPQRLFFVNTINSHLIKTQILGITKGVAQLKVSLGRFESVAFPLPPLAEQEQIVSEVERQLSIITQLEATVEANLKRAERLRQSILKEAFAGRLVPQDPNDEPASVLLERIHKEREGQKLGPIKKARAIKTISAPRMPDVEPMEIDASEMAQMDLWANAHG